MAGPNRREVMAGAGVVVAQPALAAPPSDGLSGRTARDLARYVDFGGKASGGPGDEAVGAWLSDELKTLGFEVERQGFSVPYFAVARAAVTTGAATAPVLPLAIVVETDAAGLASPLVRVSGTGVADRSLTGAIALLDLPASRWSSAVAKPISGPVRAAFAGGADAVVIVTNGPTRRAIALNADGNRPMFEKPVAILAPDQAAPFLAAAARGEAGTLHVAGNGGRRPAFNLVGRLNRGKGRWLVVSTPRSGWFVCAGERGGGVAAWLAIARWARSALPGYDLAFLCNSGHEYENLGSEKALADAAPKPAETAMWLHLGANVAARDWHDLTGTMLPLPSADPQRYFVVTPPLIDATRRFFAGQAGLEAPYPSDGFTAGELTGILAAGYKSVAGVFGAHHYHHAQEDDARCLSPALVDAATRGFQGLLRSVLAS